MTATTNPPSRQVQTTERIRVLIAEDHEAMLKQIENLIRPVFAVVASTMSYTRKLWMGDDMKKVAYLEEA